MINGEETAAAVLQMNHELQQLISIIACMALDPCSKFHTNNIYA
jgi:hypothetical protein